METDRFPILRISEQGRGQSRDIVAMELPLTIILNDQELVTLLCSPKDLEYLAIGFLFAEGFLKHKNEIRGLIVDDHRGVVRVETEEGKDFARELLFKRLITSACGRGAAFYSTADADRPKKVASKMVVSGHEVFALVNEFEHLSQGFKETGGVHSAALCDTGSILVFSQDIGRHNAIDKVFGECILKDMPTDDRMIITSGRTPSEMILKAAKGKVPILISVCAPTDLGMRLANDLGVTLIGFVRGKRLNVYTHDWRVT